MCLSILRFQCEPLRWLHALQFDQNHFKHRIPESNFITFLLGEGICEAKWLHRNPAPKTDKSFCELVDMQTSSIVWNNVTNLTYGEAPLGLTVKPDKCQSKLSNLLISYKFHYTTEFRSEINFQSYGTVTGKNTGRLRNRDWIPGKGKIYMPIQDAKTGSGVRQASFSWVPGARFQAVKAPGREDVHSSYHLATGWSISGGTQPFSHILSRFAQGKARHWLTLTLYKLNVLLHC
jgi:hypothetical protein